MGYLVPKELLGFCKVMGIFPAKNINLGRMDKLKFCTVTFLYSLSLVATQVSLSYYSLVWFSETVIKESSIKFYSMTGALVMFCNVIILTGVAIIFVISSIRGCWRLIELYQALQQFDIALGADVDQSYMRKWVFIAVIYLTALITMECGVSFEMGLMSPVFLSVFSLHYTTLAVQLQYISVVDGICRRFIVLNNKICEELTHRKPLNKLRMFGEPLSVQQLVGVTSFAAVRPMSVQSLSDLHWALCGAIHNTNSIFSWKLLAFMILLFLHIIITPYYFFYTASLYARGQQSPAFLVYLAVQLFWVFTNFSKLVLLIWPCSITTQEANKTATIICRLLNQDMSPLMKKQLETFLLQLLHHNAEFTVFGLFKLQCPILTSIAGAVTTYLVILIQFQNADGEDAT